MSSFASSPRRADINNCFLVLKALYSSITYSSIGNFNMSHKDPEVRKIQRKAYKKRAKADFMAWKTTLFCSNCGENHPATLDFHHHTPHKDNIKIRKLIADSRFGFARREIEEKCIVLCSNCHRKHHWEENKNKA